MPLRVPAPQQFLLRLSVPGGLLQLGLGAFGSFRHLVAGFLLAFPFLFFGPVIALEQPATGNAGSHAAANAKYNTLRARSNIVFSCTEKLETGNRLFHWMRREIFRAGAIPQRAARISVSLAGYQCGLAGDTLPRAILIYTRIRKPPAPQKRFALFNSLVAVHSRNHRGIPIYMDGHSVRC